MDSAMISVVIPVFNAERFLIETLESVRRQTYQNYEVICVDDGSADGSLQVLKEYQHKHSNMNITVLAQENKGPATARNLGMKYAKGRFLAFLDADDLWREDKLEKQLEFLLKMNAAFSFTGYEFADSAGNRNGKVVHVPEHITYKEALRNTTISTITVLFDREKIPKKLLLMPEDCDREDTATWWNILRNGYDAYGLDDTFSVYRRHKGSHSANKLRAVYGTFKLYRKQENMSLFQSVAYLLVNLTRAVKRRI